MRILVAVSALLVSSAASQTLKCSYIEDNTTCIVKDSVSMRAIEMHFRGRIVFSGGALISTQGGFSVSATDSITFEKNVRIKAGQRISICAGDVVFTGGAAIGTQSELQVNATGRITVEENVSITVEQHISCSVGSSDPANSSGGHAGGDGAGEDWAAQGITITGAATSVRGASINMSCSGGFVNVSGGAVLSASARTGGITTRAGNVAFVGSGTSVFGVKISIIATGFVVITSHLPGLVATRTAPAILTDLRIITPGYVHLGNDDDKWKLKSCSVLGGDILVMDQTIRTQGDTCGNRQTANGDICLDVLQLWSDNLPAGSINFDFVFAARDHLQIQSSNIFAASALLCSGDTVEIAEKVTIDSSGRGCGPGQGLGHGEARAMWAFCGAAGGSHLGKGGSGGRYDTTGGVSECALSGPTYDKPGELFPFDLLPTQGASGGGCTVDKQEDLCMQGDLAENIALPSAGGGLIWISGRDIFFGADVRVLANGNPGQVLTSKYRKKPTVSGGGAGGQILLYASRLTGTMANPAWLSAQGGAVQCTESEVGGAGGGGFIGLGLNHTRGTTPPSVVSASFQIFVTGGEMVENCEGWVPKKGLDQAYGQSGAASSLLLCAAGLSGMFCLPCPVGKWSANGSDCLPCGNKPNSQALYTTGAWTNENCPYICSPGVPHISTNPMCDAAPRYFFDFFGGPEGAVVIVSILVFTAGLLLWRTQQERHFDQECSNELAFSKEKLPYHVCRIYFSGQNSWSLPWELSGGLPEAIEPTVLAEQWQYFLAKANGFSKVPKGEQTCEAILQVLYPPAAAVYTHRRRRQRARKLRQCVRGFSEGSHGHIEFWKSIRARFHNNSFSMIFGCDRGATLGFLDFFDFNRSPFDYSPIDLHRDARVLIAHGHGSYSEPFSIDVRDPLVHHLTQTNHASAILNVIATFNRIIRTMPKDELQRCSVGPMVAHLREKVEQCATLSWPNGFVHVVFFQQCRLLRGAVQQEPPAPSFCDLMTMPSSAIRHQSSPTMRKHQGMYSRPTTSHSLVNARSALLEVIEIKLGLAFVETENLDAAELAGTGSSVGPPDKVVPLTSPIPCKLLAEHLERSSTIPQVPIKRSKWRTAMHHAMLASTLACPARRTISTVLLALIMLIYVDMLVAIFDFALLYHIDWRISAIWLFFPPLTQPCTFIMGLIFLLSESPHKGRIFASLTAFGSVNTFTSTIVYFLVIGYDSILFEIMKLLVVFFLKSALFVVANIHVRNLEEVRGSHSGSHSHSASFSNILSRPAAQPPVEQAPSAPQPAAIETPFFKPFEIHVPVARSNGSPSSTNVFAKVASEDSCRHGPSPF